MDSDQQPPWRYLLGAAQTWIDQLTDARIEAHHTDGQPFHTLPIPRRWHRCYPHSWGSCGPFELLERCPCGGTRIDRDGPWLARNTRRIFVRPGGVGPSHGRENVGDTGPDLLLQLRTALREDPHA